MTGLFPSLSDRLRDDFQVYLASGGDGSAAALWISIASAAFAGAAFALTLRREVRDRAALWVKADPMTEPDGKGGVVFIVENRGRQPITVGGLGFEWDLDRPTPGSDDYDHVLANNPWDRVRLEPGAAHTFWWQPSRALFHLDTPLRPFVESGGKRVYGPPERHLRWLAVMGWKPEMPIPPEFAQELPELPMLKRAHARWKLWKPKHTRAPFKPPPLKRSANEIQQMRDELVRRDERPS